MYRLVCSNGFVDNGLIGLRPFKPVNSTFFLAERSACSIKVFDGSERYSLPSGSFTDQ